MKAKYVIPCSALIIIILIQFLPVLITGLTYFARDLTFIFHPWRSFSAESVQQGSVPLWNKYGFCGMPFMANMQSAVWYPFSILFYLFSFSTALKIFHVIHFSIAGIGAFLLAKKYKLATVNCLTAGILFCMNGYLITKLEFLSNLGSAVWFPLLLLAKSHIVLFGIVAAISFCAGYPPILCMQIIGLIMLIPLLKDRGTKNIRIMLGGLAIGILVSSIQLLPAFELFTQSIRHAADLSIEVIGNYSLTCKDMIGLIMPYVTDRHPDQMTGEKIFWAYGLHIGISGLIITIAGIINMNKSKRIYYIMTGALVFIIGLGVNTPVFKIMYDYIPLIKLFRYPSSVLYLITMLVMCAPFYMKRVAVRYKVALLGALIIELFILNACIYPVIGRDYYRYKGETVKFLQSNLNGRRYVLTPRTQNSIGTMASDMRSGWYRIKDGLFGNIGVPFHIANADGLESLRLQIHNDIIEGIYSMPSLDAAMRQSTEAGIAYFLASYNIDDSYSHVVLSNGMNMAYNKYLKSQRPKQPYYPGWRAFINGREAGIIRDTFGWMDIEYTEASHDEIAWIYKPKTYTYGLIISVTLLMLIAYYGYILLSKQRLSGF